MTQRDLSTREESSVSIGQQVEDRAAQTAKIAKLFKARPLEDIEPDELRRITPHYQQRISECRRKFTMNIVNVPRSLMLADGTVKKLDGAYRWEPHQRLGRDAGELMPASWNGQDAPYSVGWRLTPPEPTADRRRGSARR